MRRSFKGPFKGPLSSGLLMLQGLGPGHDLCLKDLQVFLALVSSPVMEVVSSRRRLRTKAEFPAGRHLAAGFGFKGQGLGEA